MTNRDDDRHWDSLGVECPSCKTIWQDFQVDELEGVCPCGELLREEDDG